MPDPPTDRWIGAHGDPGGPGPLVVAICGVHGNEPAGAEAARRVLDWLAREQPRFRGRFVALVGNVA
ncbi:MAG: succinylglutamate desuccinylase, partial [Deltaproteobacteria bacterium]